MNTTTYLVRLLYKFLHNLALFLVSVYAMCTFYVGQFFGSASKDDPSAEMFFLVFGSGVS